MSALQKLQEKIEQWRVDHEALKAENATLKEELANTATALDESEFQVESLREERRERDEEIEKIIAQVEALLTSDETSDKEA